MNILLIILVVAAGSIVVYYIERFTRGHTFMWMDATKIGLLSGAAAGGIVYAIGGDTNVVTNIVSTSELVQDMFVGKPSF